jgi:uncharacterized protein YggE
MTSSAAAEDQPAVPYGTPDAPRIAVRGEARLEVDPEIARLTITVSARGRDRRAALDDLTRRNAAVLDLVKSYGDAVERPRRTRPHVPRRRPRHRRTVRLHGAR